MYLADKTSNTLCARQLKIGPFIISILQDNHSIDEYILPSAAEVFIHKTLINNALPDFTYIISDDVLPEIREEDALQCYYNGPTPYKISRIGSDTYLWIRYNNQGGVKLAFLISDSWSKWKLIADKSRTRGIDSFAELMYIFAYSILRQNGVMLHGVVMEWAGLGIIVCAHSGVGKSTHTNMWRSREGAEIVNGDKAICYKDNEVWYACGAPWCGSSGEYKNKSVPLKAIVLLERADINYVVKVPSLQGVMSIIKLTYAPSWNELLMNHALDMIGDMVIKIPTYKLYCRPEYGAVEILKLELGNLLNK